MKANPYLQGYNQDDIESLVNNGNIVPTIDEYSNLMIENIKGKLYNTSITIELKNMVYNSTKVETVIDPTFREI